MLDLEPYYKQHLDSILRCSTQALKNPEKYSKATLLSYIDELHSLVAKHVDRDSLPDEPEPEWTDNV